MKWITEVTESFDRVINFGPLVIRNLTGGADEIVGPPRQCVLPCVAGTRYQHKTKRDALAFVATQPDKLRLVTQ